MEIYLVCSHLKEPKERLLAISVRGSRNDTYYQNYLICSVEDIAIKYHELFVNAIKYINEALIKEKGFSIRRLDLIGDLKYLFFYEYSNKRSNGTFYDFSPEIMKNTKLHILCKELYEYLKKIKGLEINFKGWGYDTRGNMWSRHKDIRKELRQLPGDKYFDEDEAWKDFFENYL